MYQPTDSLHKKFIREIHSVINAFEAEMKVRYPKALPDDIQEHIQKIRKFISQFKEDTAKLSENLKIYTPDMVSFFSFRNPLKALKSKLQAIINQKEYSEINLLRSEKQFEIKIRDDIIKDLTTKIKNLEDRCTLLSKEILILKKTADLSQADVAKELLDKEDKLSVLAISKEKLLNDYNVLLMEKNIIKQERDDLNEDNKNLIQALKLLKEKYEKLEKEIEECPIRNKKALEDFARQLKNEMREELGINPEQQNSERRMSAPGPSFFASHP
jgi:chromosome segregation ATPase